MIQGPEERLSVLLYREAAERLQKSGELEKMVGSKEERVGARDQILFHFTVISRSQQTDGDFLPYCYAFISAIQQNILSGGVPMKFLLTYREGKESLGAKAADDPDDSMQEYTSKFFSKLLQFTGLVLKQTLQIEGKPRDESGMMIWDNQVDPKITFSITVQMEPNGMPADNALQIRNTYSNVFLASNHEACTADTLPDVSFVAGDLQFPAQNVFFSRVEIVFGQWQNGPGGWSTSKSDVAKPDGWPALNSGPIQPGREVMAATGESLSKDLTAFVETQNGKKIMCLLGSVSKDMNAQILSAVQTIFEALKAPDSPLGEFKNFGLIIRGVPAAVIGNLGKIDTGGWDPEKNTGGWVYGTEKEYIPFGLIAKHCDIYGNQFGAGSLFWGLVSGVPIFASPFMGQSAPDKNAAKKICGPGGLDVCPNCDQGSLRIPPIEERLKKYADAMMRVFSGTVADNSLGVASEVLAQYASEEAIGKAGGDKTRLVTDMDNILREDSRSMTEIGAWIVAKSQDKDTGKMDVVELPSNENMQSSFASCKMNALILKPAASPSGAGGSSIKPASGLKPALKKKDPVPDPAPEPAPAPPPAPLKSALKKKLL